MRSSQNTGTAKACVSVTSAISGRSASNACNATAPCSVNSASTSGFGGFWSLGRIRPQRITEAAKRRLHGGPLDMVQEQE